MYGCMQVVAGDAVQGAEEDVLDLGIILWQDKARVQTCFDRLGSEKSSLHDVEVAAGYEALLKGLLASS